MNRCIAFCKFETNLLVNLRPQDLEKLKLPPTLLAQVCANHYKWPSYSESQLKNYVIEHNGVPAEAFLKLTEKSRLKTQDIPGLTEYRSSLESNVQLHQLFDEVIKLILMITDWL
jgi:hypothetical protein